MYLASVPFALLIALAIAEVGAAMAKRLPLIPVVVVAGTVAIGAGILLASETREQQARLSRQAYLSEQLFKAGPELCGDLERQGYVYVVAPPVIDPSGNRTRMALNLAYAEPIFVRKVAVDELDQRQAEHAAACVLIWDNQQQTFRLGGEKGRR